MATPPALLPADPQHLINVPPQAKHTLEEAAQCSVEMRFVADAPFIHRADGLVEIDSNAPKLLIGAAQGQSFGRSDRERQAGLVAKQQPDDVAGGALVAAKVR
jgi:hypothetical protein